MVYSKIELPPGSAEEISFTIRDRNKKPIDFGLGHWTARLHIVRYPGDLDVPFYTTGTVNITGTDSSWLELVSTLDTGGNPTNSALVMTADPDITSDWLWTRKHYDCWISGPSISSKPLLIAHGPFVMDL